jgi:formamidopyrimidine-DNA glycosylase
MPELPEVETIKKEIEQALIGKKITEVKINNPKVIRQPSPVAFKKGLEERVINHVLRRGKLLILELSGSKAPAARGSGGTHRCAALTAHLKMTGQFVYPGNGTTSRVSFRFSDGSMLDFNDNRLFAELKLVNDWHALPFVKELGPDPFEIAAEQFNAMLERKKTKIKPLLMDQNFIAGIGNLYAAEMLFVSRINPARRAESLSKQEKDRLFRAMREILADAIKHKGSSVDNYVQLSGKPGEYVPQLKVYAREGKPCFGCAGKVQRITMGGRGTYFCPRCQQ